MGSRVSRDCMGDGRLVTGVRRLANAVVFSFWFLRSRLLRSCGFATHGLRKDVTSYTSALYIHSPRSRNLQRHPVGPESTAYALVQLRSWWHGSNLVGLRRIAAKAFGCAALLWTWMLDPILSQDDEARFLACLACHRFC